MQLHHTSLLTTKISLRTDTLWYKFRVLVKKGQGQGQGQVQGQGQGQGKTSR